MDIYDTMNPPAMDIEAPAGDAPVKRINTDDLNNVAATLRKLFEQYRSDRTVAEEKWLRNLRQYLGIYDPEIEKDLGARSRAYPRLTRVKCISVLSRLMNLMFPSNEKNWKIEASPSPEMSPEDVQAALQKQQAADQKAGLQRPVDDELLEVAVQTLADERAMKLSKQIEDQLQELGGDQTLDYIALNRKVVASGVLYGLGLLRGPFVRPTSRTSWRLGPDGKPAPINSVGYKPQYEFQSIWDFYGDMASKNFFDMDGHFLRMVMSRAQVRKLADRPDFIKSQVMNYLNTYQTGNYKAQSYETQLRSMGIRSNVLEMKADGKYEIIAWYGPISGTQLQQCGVDVPNDKLAEDVDAEIWMIDNTIIKADINQWRKIGAEVRTIHPFIFDEDDTSPIGNGLPNVMRDSQMSICAATRMMLDNAGVVCGPNVEVNMDLLMDGQDITSIQAYKVWYREGMGADAQFPAVRSIQIQSHIPELQSIIQLFMNMADTETFVGPATGGDMERGRGVSEPMRTAAGASMMRGDAALPFKDIVRNFDTFTQSVISSLVVFNRKFGRAPEGDYNIIARGATSLIAKEIRGMQIDNIAQTMTDREAREVNMRKLVEARFAVRDLEGLLITPAEAERRDAAEAKAAGEAAAKQAELMEAQLRETLSQAFKNISQGQKNSAAADATTVKTTLDVLEKGLQDAIGPEDGGSGGVGGAAKG